MSLPSILSTTLIGIPYCAYVFINNRRPKDAQIIPENCNLPKQNKTQFKQNSDQQFEDIQLEKEKRFNFECPQGTPFDMLETGCLEPKQIQQDHVEITTPRSCKQQVKPDSEEICNKQKWFNLFYLISLIIFVESIMSRIYIMESGEAITFSSICYLFILNALIVLFLYNLVMNFIIQLTQILLSRYKNVSQIFKFYLTLYNIFMTYPLYKGIEDQVDLDCLNYIFSIIMTTLIQLGIEKLTSKTTFNQKWILLLHN